MTEFAGRSSQVVAFVTYETPHFPCAGIAAVMRQLPYRVRAASDLPTIVISPYHISDYQLNEIPHLDLANVGVVAVADQPTIYIKKVIRAGGELVLSARDRRCLQPTLL